MLIIGCGYIGKMLGMRLLNRGNSVSGVVSSAESASHLEDQGITSLVVDLDVSPGEIPFAEHEQIYYLAPPPNDGQVDSRLSRVLDQLRGKRHTPRILYISTTGVYGDCQGDWVTEDRPLNPTTDRAKRRVDAEFQLLQWSQETGGEVVILRVAGIYGPGRLPLERLRMKAPMISENEAPFSNRIHAEDLVSVCVAAMKLGRNGQTYNVSDGKPGTMAEYFNLLADLLNVGRPPAISWAEAEQVMPPGLLSYLRENRRIDITKMQEELGVRLQYPQLETGLKASLPPGP